MNPVVSRSASIKELSFGVVLVAAVLVGSLWGCLGFISEWALIASGWPAPVAQAWFQVIGLTSCVSTAIVFAMALSRNHHWRKDAVIGLGLYLLLLWLTPRSFTYDTGLYHLPIITHLQQIGLEWNLGWLHSRYAFFNLPLYGQAAIARVAGSVALPSLNGLVLAGLLLFLLDQTRRQPRLIIPCLIVSGALLIPSEATESFHSFNADFTLGCVFLMSTVLTLNSSVAHSPERRAAFLLAALMPAIKLSGAFLLPVFAAASIRRWGITECIRELGKCAGLIALIASTAGLFGWITTGYLAYPVASTGPLRRESIAKENVVNEAKFNTAAWARYAYSGQISSIKSDAKPVEWLPQWSKSLNGKRMLSYLMLSAIATATSWHRSSKASILPVVLVANTGFWAAAILILPPDPRFYLGPILLTLYALGLELTDIMAPNSLKEQKRLGAKFICAVACMTTLTSLWRHSDVPRNAFPAATFENNARVVTGAYRPLKKVQRAKNGTCWNLEAPCIP